MTPEISVVICTHNRAGVLREAIESVVEQTAAFAFELVVVDNGSSDSTPHVVRQFERHGFVRYEHEAALGLCYARNTGWQKARGDIVAYLDDDAIALPGWLKAVAEAFMLYPNAGIAGGRVEPIWEAPRPAWLSDNIALSLSILDWCAEAKAIDDIRLQWLVGTNIALRRHLLEEVDGFDPSLDRVGSNYLSNGDIDLQMRVLDSDREVIYFPAMAVRHRVPASRLSKSWFRRRYYWQGLSDAAMELVRQAPGRRARLRRAGRAAVNLLTARAAYAALLGRKDDPLAFQMQCLSLIKIGRIAGLLGALGR